MNKYDVHVEWTPNGIYELFKILKSTKGLEHHKENLQNRLVLENYSLASYYNLPEDKAKEIIKKTFYDEYFQDGNVFYSKSRKVFLEEKKYKVSVFWTKEGLEKTIAATPISKKNGPRNRLQNKLESNDFYMLEHNSLSFNSALALAKCCMVGECTVEYNPTKFMCKTLTATIIEET